MIELLDEIRLAFVKVHGVRVREGECADLVQCADGARSFVGCFLDGVRYVVDIAERDLRGGIAALRPVVVSTDAPHVVLVSEQFEACGGEFAEEARRFGGGDGELMHGAADVSDGDMRVGRVDNGVLGRLTEEVFAVVHDVLVDRHVLPNENHE